MRGPEGGDLVLAWASFWDSSVQLRCEIGTGGVGHPHCPSGRGWRRNRIWRVLWDIHGEHCEEGFLEGSWRRLAAE